MLNKYAARYKTVYRFPFWRVRVGDGTALYGRYLTHTGALRQVSMLAQAFYDGKYVGERQGKVGCKNFRMRDSRMFCKNCGFHYDEH